MREKEIAKKLKTKLFKYVDGSSSGCISSANTYETDRGKVFVKVNHKDGAEVMFEGEYHGLLALKSYGFPVPSPLCFGKTYIVMEYVDLKSLDKFSFEMGQNLAILHNKKTETVKFGFKTTTCGFWPSSNVWEKDWVQFYVRHRLEPIIRHFQSDRELNGLWSRLQLLIPKFFENVQIKPSLLHGDLWSGNVGDTNEGPIAFDPAAFYGHSEFDLAIGKMFGGFSQRFFDGYHGIIPRGKGFKERGDLYLLYHHLNHWRHFGESYRKDTVDLMAKLISIAKKIESTNSS